MSVLDDLRKLSSAEDFFAFLGVPSDPAVVRVARLHILRRMGDYLRREPLDALDELTTRQRCREHLETAYADFAKSSPLEQRVFKVLKDAVAPKSKPFVPLSALRKLGKQG
jgi:nitrogenase-stabilizing/protective protein